MSLKTWVELLHERFFLNEPEAYGGVVRKIPLSDIRSKVRDLPEALVHELIENVESLRRSTIIEGYILSYNPFIKVLSIFPELDLEVTQLLHNNNKEVIDLRIRNLILSMSPFAFEEFVVDLLRSVKNPQGGKKYSRVALSKKTRDGGTDFRAYFFDENKSRRVLFGEVKHWSKPVDEKVIDRLSKTMERESRTLSNAPLGVVVSLVGASAIAMNTARNEKIELWDLSTLVRLVKETGLGLRNVALDLPDASYWSEYDAL